MEKEVALTTVDNPFNPFTQKDEWHFYDIEHNYGTCELLARIAKTSSSFTDEENFEIINDAIDEIIKNDYEKKYKKVYKE